mgnify:FL=1
MKFQGKDYECGSVKVGERGQIVIPQNVRDEIGINHGDDLIILGNKEDGIKIIVANSLEELAEIVLKSKKKGK